MIRNLFTKAYRKVINGLKRKKTAAKPTVNQKLAGSGPNNGKKVLMFGWELPPFNSGGLGVACYELTKSMAKKNNEVTFVLPRKQDVDIPFMNVDFADQHYDSTITDLTEEEKTNLRIHKINSLISPYITNEEYFRKLTSEKQRKHYFELLKLGKYGDDLIAEVFRYGKAAGSIAKKRNFDVIHAHDWLSYPAGIEAKRVSKKPLVAHVHALEYDRSSEEGADSRVCAIERRGLEVADKIIAVSNYTKQRIIKFYNIPEAKIQVVYNGINAELIAGHHANIKSMLRLKKNGKKIVLFTGRITYQKGVDYLISASKKIATKSKQTIFMIVGSGDMLPQIIQQAAKLGISDRVFFPGFLRGNELQKIYAMADVYVMPSVSEPFGIVALEALAHRIPTILSKQSGASEIIENALKVDFWDTDQLANKILAILNHNSLSKSLSDYGFEDAKKFTWDLAADRCLEVYNLVTV